ncbi:hypothetical protein X801_04997 [Opisthorchis viverrini]|uniref:Uncharacterized protein n=2 Tax=Opisthorchis viverrini TaxID=6198 RepID=A0A1S8WXJ8_OPIVI|nr:hypothetical protein T265_06205 [Opisthorchis viverrini]KER26561.1 hypothetical protein T265_06205 [Opisthorchis viverrini]OON19141.1 hypothetical protein X801_04997 [Opisthorchis viverrini]
MIDPQQRNLETADKEQQNQRENDVQLRWQEVIDKGGEGAPEWMKEAAARRKAAQEKESTLAPWIKELKLKNKDLARKAGHL